MKKSLLLAAAGLSSLAALAGVDNGTYEPFNGLQFKSKFVYSQVTDLDGWNKYQFADPNYTKNSRDITVGKVDGVDRIIVPNNIHAVWKEATETSPAGYTYEQGQVMAYILDMGTGKQVGEPVAFTCDGQPVTGFFANNSVGTDDFGNVWFANMVSTGFGDEDAPKYISVYSVDDFKTGACTLRAHLTMGTDGGGWEGTSGRVDYVAVAGDITGKEGGSLVMAAPSSGDAADTQVYGWSRAAGEEEWTGAFGGYIKLENPIAETNPEGMTTWATAYTYIPAQVNPAEPTPDVFYIDAFNTRPALYGAAGDMRQSFATAEAALWPTTGPNGITEMKVGDQNFLFYVLTEHSTKSDWAPNTAMIASCDDTYDFSTLKQVYTIPTGGLGNLGSSAARLHPCIAKNFVDVNGVDGAYVIFYTEGNGIAVYTLAPEEWIDPFESAGVNDIMADDTDNNAPVEYFNLNGQKVSNPAPGLYITRQGNKVAKKLVK